MRLMASVFAFFLIPGMLLCQGVEGGATILPYPLPVADQLKTYLNLTDGQIAGLQQVQTRKQEAERKIYEEMQQKSQALNAMLEMNSTDAARIGQLMIEIQKLRKQLPVSGEPYRSQALAVLSADQRTKLPALVQAMQLQPAAYQAISFNLFDHPDSGPRILPAFAPEIIEHTAVTSGLFPASRSSHTRE